MQFFRCCRVLKRRMSPLMVGLIINLIISSTSADDGHLSNLSHPRHHQGPTHHFINKVIPFKLIPPSEASFQDHFRHKEKNYIKPDDFNMVSLYDVENKICGDLEENSTARCISLVRNLVNKIIINQAMLKEAFFNPVQVNHNQNEDNQSHIMKIKYSAVSGSNPRKISYNYMQNFYLKEWKFFVEYVKLFLRKDNWNSAANLSKSLQDDVNHYDDTYIVDQIWNLKEPYTSLNDTNTISKGSITNNNNYHKKILNEKNFNVTKIASLNVSGLAKSLQNSNRAATNYNRRRRSLNISDVVHAQITYSNKAKEVNTRKRNHNFNNYTLRHFMKSKGKNPHKRHRRGRNFESDESTNSFDDLGSSDFGHRLKNDLKRSSENEITAKANENTTPSDVKYDRSSIYPSTALFNPKRTSNRRQSLFSDESNASSSLVPTLYQILKPRLRNTATAREDINILIVSTTKPTTLQSSTTKSSKLHSFTAKPSTLENEIMIQNDTESSDDHKFEADVNSTSNLIGSIMNNVAYLSKSDSLPIKVDISRSNMSATDELNKSIYAANNTIFIDVMGTVLRHQHSAVTVPSVERQTTTPSGDMEDLRADESERVVQTAEDPSRKPKMSDRTRFNVKELDSKTYEEGFSVPEFRPGTFVHYSDIFQRMPVLNARRPSFGTRNTAASGERRSDESKVTEAPSQAVKAVSSTFYPNRMKDVPLRFGSRYPTTAIPTVPSKEQDSKSKVDSNEDLEDDEYRDAIDPGFTMEKLAYLLIGTCCGLSILCLCVVMAAIRCRRVLVEKRLKTRFRKKLFHHNHMKSLANGLPWPQPFLDHYMYLHGHPDSSCSSRDSCNCKCVTWSLGARNLDTRPILCPGNANNNRNSLFLCGQKKLPFGAASTLRYESMLGRKRPSPTTRPKEEDLVQTTPNPDSSSHENDSLDQESEDSLRESVHPNQCTCIDYPMWPMHEVRRFGPMCPLPGRCIVMGDCHPNNGDLQTIARDCPPPVTGSNYLDRSEGVVYWSSNDERLI